MTTTLEEARIPLRLKLSAAWGALMFLFTYADYFGLFRDGAIEDIMREPTTLEESLAAR